MPDIRPLDHGKSNVRDENTILVDAWLDFLTSFGEPVVGRAQREPATADKPAV